MNSHSRIIAYFFGVNAAKTAVIAMEEAMLQGCKR